MIREILIWPHPSLKQRAEPVTQFGTEELRTLLRDMTETMAFAKGAGLAAPQIGVALRVVTLLVRQAGDARVLQLVNPRILSSTPEVQRTREGCLSLPGFVDTVPRSKGVVVEAFDDEGQRFELGGEGFLALMLQHELEHLDGIVFVDHLSPLKRNLAKKRYEKAKARGLRYATEPRPGRPPPQDFTEVEAAPRP